MLLKIIKKPDLYLQEILDNGFWDYHQMPQKHYANNIHERKINDIDLFLSFKDLSVFFKKLGIDDSKTINKNSHPKKKKYIIFLKQNTKKLTIYTKKTLTL